MSQSATTEQKGRKADRPSDGGPIDVFRRAVAHYHDCVGQVVARYSEQLQKLNDEYVEAVQEASRAASWEEQLEALDKAARRYNNEAQESADRADAAVKDCLKGYAEQLKKAFGQVKPDQVDPATLEYIGRETTFIAYAAAGAFPPAWWLPIAED